MALEILLTPVSFILTEKAPPNVTTPVALNIAESIAYHLVKFDVSCNTPDIRLPSENVIWLGES